MLAALSSHNARREVNLNQKSNVFYLANGEEIKPCSFESISEFYDEEHDFNLSFYKVEALGAGKIGIKNLNKSKDEDFENLFDDLE